jgi:hypothetical protein
MDKYFKVDPAKKLIRSAILLLGLATLLLTSLRVLGHGYFPPDDALRHVAKVVSGKDWHEILVIRPEITMDSHPGWHFILDSVGKAVHYDKTLLLNFSVLSLFLLFTCTPFFLFKRQEAWLAALMIAAVFSTGCIHRLFLGRPYIFSMFVILMFCFLWSRIKAKKLPVVELAAYTLLCALSTWIHGTWYLLSLPLAALFFCTEWRVFFLMSAATIIGILIGALLTGSPYAFIHQMIYHAITAFGSHDFQRQLVTEFRPFAGEPLVLSVVAALLVLRVASNRWSINLVYNPVFILAGMGWMFGFVASRFWSDWGFPALAFWMATEISALLESSSEGFATKRCFLVIILCLGIFLSVSNDRGNRWSRTQPEWPDITNSEHRPWLPDDGGIVYNDSMGLFYEMFYHNPTAPWRYTLGFEPIWMPPNLLETYRNIQLTRGNSKSYEPWVGEMTPKDRMILVRNTKPDIKGLDWHEVTSTVWSGRLAMERNR